MRWTNICLFKPQNRIIVLHLKLQSSRATSKCYPILKILCTQFYLYNWHRLNGCQPHFYNFYFLTVCYGPPYCIVLYCIVSIHLYSASCSAHQSEALPVRETQREESSLERTKRGTW